MCTHVHAVSHIAIWSTNPDHKRVHTCRCRLLRVTLAYRDTLTQGTWGRTGSPGIAPGLSELLWHTGILRHRVSGGELVGSAVSAVLAAPSAVLYTCTSEQKYLLHYSHKHGFQVKC